MSDFAKVFGSGDNQIAIICHSNDDGNPCVTLFYKAEELGVSSMSIDFEDSTEGEQQSEVAFLNITEETARKIVSRTLKELGLTPLT